MADHLPDPTEQPHVKIPATEWSKLRADACAAEKRSVQRARQMLDGRIRALTVRRPWANLIVTGHKRVENRSWYTTHRGRLIIHAGRAWEPDGAAAAEHCGLTGFSDISNCPTGYLGMVRVDDVHPSTGCRTCGPWASTEPGQYHWILSEPQSFAEPVPGRGRQGLYWAPEDALAAIG